MDEKVVFFSYYLFCCSSLDFSNVYQVHFFYDFSRNFLNMPN